ncbi:hypothetical protein IFM89_019354 [Coptis chinensis]|uniref:SHSP domain-containing protein n=1 Tax=Coptis chinensis TaxID=261450 RepID=A0A835IWK9_9MAGN|nr:hypothetical protein IFM89_019354 [Coptis chinensis]
MSKFLLRRTFPIIKGEADSEWSGNNYSTKFVIGKDRFKVDKIQAEMKNGVLKVTVPKLKYEERKNSDSLYLFSDSL